MKIKKLLMLLLCSVLLAWGAAGCGDGAGDNLGGLQDMFTPTEAEDPYPLYVKVGFVYSGTVSSNPHAEVFEAARDSLMKTQGVDTVYMENVLVQQFDEAAQRLINNGCNVIVSTDSRYAAAVKIAASKQHEIVFISFGASDRSHNLSSIQPLTYEAANVLGLIAAYNTDTNKVGMIVDRNMYNAYAVTNAFALGARDLPHSQVEFRVSWVLSDNFSDTREAIDEFIADGCDILFVYQFENYAIRRAEELGVKVIAYSAGLPAIAPENYLSGMYLNLNTYLIDNIRKVQYDTFFGESTRKGLEYGTVGMIRLNDNLVRAGTLDLTNAFIGYIEDNLKDIFGGEIRDTAGAIRVPKGDTLSMTQIFGLETAAWLADNIAVERFVSTSRTQEELIFSDFAIKETEKLPAEEREE